MAIQERKRPARTWSSGPREESPHTSQTTLPWISPVQALAPKANNNNRIRLITIFCPFASMVEKQRKGKKKRKRKNGNFLSAFLLSGSFVFYASLLLWELSFVYYIFATDACWATESNARVNNSDI